MEKKQRNRQKLIKKIDKCRLLKEMIEESYFNNHLTNWHLSDFFLDFISEYYEDKHSKQQSVPTSTARATFNRYANILVSLNILEKAHRLGVGYGGYSEFGVRTATSWAYNFGIGTKEEALKILKTYCRRKQQKI